MGNSASALPFSIDNQVGNPTDHNGWALHNGKSTDGSNKEVTVFVGKKPLLTKQPAGPRFPNSMMFVPALHHYNNCRKLRHPHILKVYATLDTDNPTAATTDGSAAAASGGEAEPTADPKMTGDLIIVTEPCIPFEQWLLNENPSPEQLAWGLESIIRGLQFLHSSANLSHGNLAPSSFYVTKSSDVKIWNFSLITPTDANFGPNSHFTTWEEPCTPDAYRSPERVNKQYNLLQTTHAMDSYGLGVLIDHIYSGNIPQQLQKAVQRLMTQNVKMRPRLQPLLKCPVFHTPYQKLQLQLEEITIQPVEQKVALWGQMGSTFQNGLIPKDLALFKILPLIQSSIQTICTNENMLTQDLYRREVLAMLTPMFYILENYADPSTAGDALRPLVALLFLVKDRGVRGVLLNKVPFMTKHLDKNTLNSSVFEPLCSGFNDSSPALRELTLKATLNLVPHLNQPSVEKLSRYLIRLQGDTETSIRTNSVIFIARLASHLSEVTMQKVLMPAYARAMKDTFPPCRLAALQSCLKTKSLFPPQDIAVKVLPAVMPLLLDPMANVRKEAFQVVNEYMNVLKEESDKMEVRALEQQRQQAMQHQQQQQQVPAASTSGPTPASISNGPAAAAAVPQAAPKSGGYLSGLGSWMSSSTKPADSSAPNPPAASAVPVAPQAAAPIMSTPALPPVQQFASTSLAAPPPAAAVDDGWGDDSIPAGDGDGWGDDDNNVGGDDDSWGDDDNDLAFSNIGKNTASTPSSTYTTTPKQFAAATPSSADPFDDPFASLGMKTTTTTTTARPKGKLVLPSKKPAAGPAMKLKVDKSDMGDGWDDF